MYLYFNRAESSNSYSKNLIISDIPLQKMIKTKVSKKTNKFLDIIFNFEDANIVVRPIAEYSITARVLRKERYYFGWSSDISPYDFALAWGIFGKKEYKNIEINQRNRWYYFKPKAQCKLPIDKIYLNSANNHIIPATKNLKKLLLQIDRYAIVHFEGYLVKVFGIYKGGSVNWNSSLSRSDRGNHSCEVFYVNKIIYNNKIYK